MKIKQLIAITGVVCSCFTAILASAEEQAKNVILLISDGWGYNTILATDYYNSGTENTNPYADFPVYTAMANYMSYFESADGSLVGPGADADQSKPAVFGYDGAEAASNFDYIGEYYTDSAAAVTAMASGQKTFQGAIGVGTDLNDITNIVDVAHDMGKATGSITSVQFSHATPAGFYAHTKYRSDYRYVAHQGIFDSKLNVLMGCGHPLYNNDGTLRDEPKDKYIGGIDVYNGLVEGLATMDWAHDITDPFTGEKESFTGTSTVQDIDGDGNPDVWHFIENRADFQALATGDTPLRVFGLAKANSTLQYNRPTDAAAKIAYNHEATIDQIVLEPSAAKAAYEDNDDIMTAPYADPQVEIVPTLEEMTRASLNILDNDPDGFFLHVEGGAVDWAGHGNWLGRMIEEQTDFNNAVQAVIDWVETNSSWDETLVIVTGDHETGFLTGPNGREDNEYFKPVVNNGQGVLPTGEFYSGSHTNQVIPLYAKGAFSNMLLYHSTNMDPQRGQYMDNTEIFEVMKSAMEGAPTAVEDEPVEFNTLSNYPNPFNPVTTIAFNVALTGTVKMTIYDVLGHKVDTLVDEVMAPGSYEITWDASSYASGTYFCSLELFGNKVLNHKLTLVK